MISHNSLNLTYIRNLSAGNNRFIVRMLQSFCNNVPSGVNELLSKATRGEMHDVKQLAHKLKTMFRYVGMEHVAEDLERLEFHAAEMNESERNNLLNRIENASKRAIIEAQDVILTTPV
jgi:HPt (histidine-containing phosphotransfer) domain-containing protein